jgi:putative endonuclease
MASVYILHSTNLNRFYIGSCLDLSERIGQHQNKVFRESFTSKADDWVLYLSINDLQYSQARKIETHIKKMHSSVFIKNLKEYPQMQERLIQKYAQ